MKVLVDTHILLWWMVKDRKLSKKAEDIIADPNNRVLVSSVCIWEIAVKQALGRISISIPKLIDVIDTSGFESLPITFAHCSQLTNLPPVHKDPFDRMLISQCLSENCNLLTHDDLLSGYGPVVLLS